MIYTVGIDLGGTNIKALAVTSRGRVLYEANTPTGDDGTSAWQGNVRAAIRAAIDHVGREPAGVGIAAPGLASRAKDRISFMPGRLPGLEGLEWRRFLQLAVPVKVLNDAHAALMGEIWQGAAAGSKNAFMLTLGTGVGGAAVVDGHLLSGHIGRAGHLGHVSLNAHAPRDIVNCPGSLEDAIGDCTVVARTAGRFGSTRALVSAVRKGDRDATAIWMESVRQLAAAIASLVNVLDPEIVILGGGISKAGRDLTNPLKGFLKEFEWRPGGSRVSLKLARLGDRAGAFGAASVALRSGPAGVQPSSGLTLRRR